jgi:hypothetical protein
VSALLVYKIVWLNFLYFHYFASDPAKLIPGAIIFFVFGTGLFSLIFHKLDKKNYGLILHKVLFLVFSFVPFAVDNRTTVAIFESAIVIFYLTMSPGGFQVKQAFFWLLGLTFFFAGFHKINSTHFFSAGSCSKLFLERGLALFHISLSSSAAIMAPWIVVTCELLVPLFLAFRFYRAALILVSMILLSFTLVGYSNFTALLLVLAAPLFFVIPERRLKNLVLVPWLASFAAIVFLRPESPPLLAFFNGMVIIAILANVKLQSDTSPCPKTVKLLTSLFVALFFFNGMSIYLGYKNQGVLAMYSNLQVYNSHSNHLLLKRQIALSNNLSDLVTVVASDQAIHKDILEGNGFIPLKLFKSQAKYFLQAGVTPNIIFKYQGREQSLKSRDDLLQLSADLSFMERHFLNLGYINLTQTECRW